MDAVLANPPASSGDDGFGFRRLILREAAGVLEPGGLLVMQWLSYYTGPGPIPERVREALEDGWHSGVIDYFNSKLEEYHIEFGHGKEDDYITAQDIDGVEMRLIN